MEFKVGDRVRFSKKMDGHNHGPYVKNDDLVRSIIAIDSDRIRLEGLSENWFREHELELVDTSKFTKSDLQEGDIVTDREGAKSLYLNGDFAGETLSFGWFNDDLKNKDRDTGNDIVKVERPAKLETVFERKEVREMTMAELCEHFGCPVKIVKEKE